MIKMLFLKSAPPVSDYSYRQFLSILQSYLLQPFSTCKSDKTLRSPVKCHIVE